MLFNSIHKKLDLVIKLLATLIIKENKLADALKDLQDAESKNEASTLALLKAIADKLASFDGAVPASEAEAIVARINAVTAQEDAQTAALAVPVVTGTGS